MPDKTTPPGASGTDTPMPNRASRRRGARIRRTAPRQALLRDSGPRDLRRDKRPPRFPGRQGGR